MNATTTSTRKESQTYASNPLDLVLCDNPNCDQAVINGGVPSADGLGIFCSTECKTEEFNHWLWGAETAPLPGFLKLN